MPAQRHAPKAGYRGVRGRAEALHLPSQVLALNRKLKQPTGPKEANLLRTEFLRITGVFTVHGKDERALEVQSQDVVEQVEIPTELQEPLRELLKEAGIHHYCVFPDLDGLARRLRHRYGWR